MCGRWLIQIDGGSTEGPLERPRQGLEEVWTPPGSLGEGGALRTA